MTTSRQYFPSGPPQFNHVAMTLPADALDAQGRADIVAFYRQVLGWREMTMLTVDRESLVLALHTPDQFIYLTGVEVPMTVHEEDHFGMSVGSMDELLGVHQRATAYAERDDRVEVSAPEVFDYKMFSVHSVYVRYVLPMQLEVQFLQRTRRAPAAPGA